MTKQRVERLIHLHALKKEQTHVHYLEFIKFQEQLKQNSLKQEQLVGYRQDYLEQLETLGNEGTQVGRLRNRIDFINQLDTAIVQLKNYLSQLTKQKAKAELIYTQAKAAEDGVEKLIGRVKKTQEIKVLKSEQKESDEYAQKQWYSKSINDQTKLIQ